jgi:hypothetical protein
MVFFWLITGFWNRRDVDPSKIACRAFYTWHGQWRDHFPSVNVGHVPSADQIFVGERKVSVATGSIARA